MEPIKEKIKLREFKPPRHIPEFLTGCIGELPDVTKDLVKDIESFYAEIAYRLNKLIKIDVDSAGNVKVKGLNAACSEYTDNTAALAAGLKAGDFYRTGDAVKVVH